MLLRLPLVTLAVVSMMGCGGSDDPVVVLYKSTGSLQCAPTQTTQARLDAEVSALRQAGASVTASSCANQLADGAQSERGCGRSRLAC